MKDLSELRSALVLFEQQHQELITDATILCCDKSIPLQERWELFSRFDLNNRRIFCPPDLKSINAWEYVAANAFDRGDEVNLVELVEENSEGDSSTLDWINSIKEELLEAWTFTFVYDW